jgi:CheY-like chemotaxis protein
MNGNEPLVCIIDDELSLRESLSDLLESVGLKAQAFASADEFLTKWSSEVPGCLVLDIQLPGISGLDLQQQLRNGDTQIPIERAVILARGGAPEFDLPGNGCNPSSVERMYINQPEPEYLTEPEIRRRERENLFAVLQKTGWKIKGVDGAAELLGVRPATLAYKDSKNGFEEAGE